MGTTKFSYLSVFIIDCGPYTPYPNPWKMWWYLIYVHFLYAKFLWEKKNVCSQFCILRQYQWANFRKKQISAVQVLLHCLSIIKWLQYHSSAVKKCNTYTLWIALMSHLAPSTGLFHQQNIIHLERVKPWYRVFSDKVKSSP